MDLECITIFDHPDKYDIGDAIDEHYSLAQLNEEWEDYEETKEYWYIEYDGEILCVKPGILSGEKAMVSIGNHFKTKEEAEKAVEKLKAWKRLKDKGFMFKDYDVLEPLDDVESCGQVFFRCGNYSRCEIVDDLDLLFGGEE